jgi:DNA-binding MltR family transcriptional regulator
MSPNMTEFADNLNAFIESVHHQSRMTHSGVVIAASAILETRLERVLKQALRPMSKAMHARLFDSFRPLSSFSSKIMMAYALGAITRDVFDELEKIRAIRNEFAHSAELLHFESATIARKFSTLKRPPTTSKRPTEVFLECVRAIDDSLEAYLIRTAVSQETG